MLFPFESEKPSRRAFSITYLGTQTKETFNETILCPSGSRQCGVGKARRAQGIQHLERDACERRDDAHAGKSAEARAASQDGAVAWTPCPDPSVALAWA